MQSNKLSKQKNYKEILKGHNDIILAIEIFEQTRLKSVASDGSFRGLNYLKLLYFFFLKNGILQINKLFARKY